MNVYESLGRALLLYNSNVSNCVAIPVSLTTDIASPAGTEPVWVRWPMGPADTDDCVVRGPLPVVGFRFRYLPIDRNEEDEWEEDEREETACVEVGVLLGIPGAGREIRLEEIRPDHVFLPEEEAGDEQRRAEFLKKVMEVEARTKAKTPRSAEGPGTA